MPTSTMTFPGTRRKSRNQHTRCLHNRGGMALECGSIVEGIKQPIPEVCIIRRVRQDWQVVVSAYIHWTHRSGCPDFGHMPPGTECLKQQEICVFPTTIFLQMI